VAHLVFSSTALAFLTSMSEKRKSASPNAFEVKNRRKTIGIEEKLRVIMRREGVNELLIYAVMLRLAHDIVHKIRDNVDRIKAIAKSELKCWFV
jgi:hypothetical protein